MKSKLQIGIENAKIAFVKNEIDTNHFGPSFSFQTTKYRTGDQPFELEHRTDKRTKEPCIIVYSEEGYEIYKIVERVYIK